MREERGISQRKKENWKSRMEGESIEVKREECNGKSGEEKRKERCQISCINSPLGGRFALAQHMLCSLTVCAKMNLVQQPSAEKFQMKVDPYSSFTQML